MKYRFLSILLATTVISAGAFKTIDAEALMPKPTEHAEHFDRAKMHEKMAERFTKELDLTEEQQEKAKEIHEQGKKDIEPLMDQMNMLREKLDAKRRTNMEEFEKILTPEQKTKFEELKKNAPEHERMHGPKFGPRGHHNHKKINEK